MKRIIGPSRFDDAKMKGWTVISMKDGWKRVFMFENK